MITGSCSCVGAPQGGAGNSNAAPAMPPRRPREFRQTTLFHVLRIHPNKSAAPCAGNTLCGPNAGRSPPAFSRSSSSRWHCGRRAGRLQLYSSTTSSYRWRQFAPDVQHPSNGRPCVSYSPSPSSITATLGRCDRKAKHSWSHGLDFPSGWPIVRGGCNGPVPETIHRFFSFRPGD